MTDGYENERKTLNTDDIGYTDAKIDGAYACDESSIPESGAECGDKAAGSDSGVSDFKTAHDRICSDFESKEGLESSEAEEFGSEELSDGAEISDGESSVDPESPVDAAPESAEVESHAEIGADFEPLTEESKESTDSVADEITEIFESDSIDAASGSSEKTLDAGGSTSETSDGEIKTSEAEKTAEHAEATESDRSTDEKLEEQFKQVMFSNLVSKIDYDCTLPTITSAEIADEAGKAVEFGFGSVCILASRMKTFKKQSKTQRFCAVIAYPSGEMTEKSKICEIKEATFGGAAEIDVFFRISALKDEKRRLIVRSLVKYGKVIGRKRIYKLSIDSTMVSKEEAQFIVQAAAEAKVDYLVVRNCDFADTRTQLFYAKLCAGKCKLEFAHNVSDLSSMTKLTDIGTERFLLANATEVATRLREELNDK